MQSLELEETPFIDLGLLRYVVCMMFKAVPVAKGEAFLVVAQRYLSLLDYLNQLELPIRLSSGLSTVAVLDHSLVLLSPWDPGQTAPQPLLQLLVAPGEKRM